MTSAEPARVAEAAPAATPAPVATPVLAVPTRSDDRSPGNFALEWRSARDGGGALAIAYEGPLAAAEALTAWVGTWRDGAGPWGETREVALERAGDRRFVGTIPVPPGAPVRGVEFALRAADGAWDNGGRSPLGYYEWRPEAAQVEVAR